jgi:DEAD/DEAH box helicase domain-containing protein
MITEIIFDVETKKLFSDIITDDPGQLGVSIVSVYKRTVNALGEEESGQMQSFWEKDFNQMWPWFTNANRIIGFNTLKFDVPALRPYTTIDLEKLPHFDIMEFVRQKVGRRISLNALAGETLGNVKTDQGTNAVLYWAKGDPVSLGKLRTYCEADVILTRNLYDFGKKYGFVKYKDKWNDSVRVEIDFSYPKTEDPPPQIGLF